MFQKNDNVLVTCQILKKTKNGTEKINLIDESGTIRKAKIYKDSEKNTYYVATEYGMHILPESVLILVEE